MDPILLVGVVLAFVFAIGKIAERWGPPLFAVMVIALVLESLYYALR